MHVLQIVSRTGKLAYEWRGLKHLPELLDRLVADQVSHMKGSCLISAHVGRMH